MVCVCFLGLLYACGTNKTNFNNNKMSDWSKYDVGRVDFQNLAPETEGVSTMPTCWSQAAAPPV